MVAHAGEKAQETGVFHCAKCGEKVQVRAGRKIPSCPNGHREFDRRTAEPSNR
jgi:ribosomal protein L37AE/L43A